MSGKTFAGRFISKLEKIDQGQIEQFLTQLTQERDFLQVVLNSIREGIIVTDVDLHILFLNESAEKLLGLSSSRKMLGEPLQKIIRQRNLSETIALYDFDSGDILEREVNVTVPSKRIYSLSIVPVKKKPDEVTSYVFLIADVTEVKKREQDRVKEDKLSSLGTLVAGIAHEIKNPLNSLNIHTQLLHRSIDTSDQEEKNIDKERLKQTVGVILEETGRLSGIVDQFIQAVRPSKPELTLGNVNMVIRKVAETMKSEMEERGITLTLTLEPDLPEILLDVQQLFQAFRNIVKNSIEAMLIDRPGIIEIRTSTSDQNIVIDFIDNGCGIKEKELVKIFEPYYTTKFGGSGLGLMIVYRIINEHHGAISVESGQDKGSTFSITFPVVKRHVKLISHKAGKTNEA